MTRSANCCARWAAIKNCKKRFPDKAKAKKRKKCIGKARAKAQA